MKNFSNYNDYSTKEELHFESKAVHGALGTEPLTGAVSMPIFQTATFRHPELGESTGFAYSRLENPTRQELERTMAILEGGIKGFAFSSACPLTPPSCRGTLQQPRSLSLLPLSASSSGCLRSAL